MPCPIAAGIVEEFHRLYLRAFPGHVAIDDVEPDHAYLPYVGHLVLGMEVSGDLMGFGPGSNGPQIGSTLRAIGLKRR
jgi:hypothetical protein